MSTESQVMALLEQGNPATEVEDAAWSAMSAAEHLAIAEKRSSDMTRLEKDTIEPTERKWPVGWLAAAAIAAVLLGIGVIVVSQRQTDEVQPAATTTVAPTTSAAPGNLGAARELVDIAYEPDPDGLSALPWAFPNAPQEVVWLSAYMGFANAEVTDSTCGPDGIAVVCIVRSVDDVSRLIDETADYEDTIRVHFNESTGQIVSARWSTEWRGLDEFSAWIGTQGDAIFDAGGVCDPAADQPGECAQALMQLADQYVSTQGS